MYLSYIFLFQVFTMICFMLLFFRFHDNPWMAENQCRHSKYFSAHRLFQSRFCLCLLKMKPGLASLRFETTKFPLTLLTNPDRDCAVFFRNFSVSKIWKKISSYGFFSSVFTLQQSLHSFVEHPERFSLWHWHWRHTLFSLSVSISHLFLHA